MTGGLADDRQVQQNCDCPTIAAREAAVQQVLLACGLSNRHSPQPHLVSVHRHQAVGSHPMLARTTPTLLGPDQIIPL